MLKRTIEDYLKNDYCAIKANGIDYFGEKIYKHIMRIIDESYNETGIPVLENDIAFYLIPKNVKTQMFYEELTRNKDKRQLYLIFDKTHNYMESNSNQFFLEMWLLKGLTIEEVKEDPLLLSDYILKVRTYLGHLE